jgi:hypothetical protein
MGTEFQLAKRYSIHAQIIYKSIRCAGQMVLFGVYAIFIIKIIPRLIVDSEE